LQKGLGQGISTVTELLTLEKVVNRDFKLAALDYVAIVMEMHAKNNITLRYFEKMKNKKRQKNSMVRLMSKKIMQSQINGMDATYVKLTNIHKVFVKLAKVHEAMSVPKEVIRYWYSMSY